MAVASWWKQARLEAILINTHRAKRSGRVKPLDMHPHLAPLARRAVHARLTKEESKRNFEIFKMLVESGQLGWKKRA